MTLIGANLAEALAGVGTPHQNPQPVSRVTNRTAQPRQTMRSIVNQSIDLSIISNTKAKLIHVQSVVTQDLDQSLKVSGSCVRLACGAGWKFLERKIRRKNFWGLRL
jgi:hypothetical protein